MSWIGDNAVNLIDSLLGVFGLSESSKHNRKAEELAEQQQQFNETFSTQELAQQQKQFEQNYAQAQQNIDFQKEYAEKNFAMQQDVFNAQLQENALTRKREDTAIQRQVADLQAAGLSPLMATGGAATSGQTLASAPQYDLSGVSNAQGSALQLAQEYAALRNMAAGNYLNRRQQAVNQRIGAKQALAQLTTQYVFQGQNLALQTRNLKQQIKESEERIEASKAQRIWNSEHGYRNESWMNYAVAVLQNLMSPEEASKKINELVQVGINEGIPAMKNALNELKNVTPDMKKGIEEAVSTGVAQLKKGVDDSVSDIKNSVSKTLKLDKYSFNLKMSDKNAFWLSNPFVTNNRRFERLKSEFYNEHENLFKQFGMYKYQFEKLNRFQISQLMSDPYDELKKWSNSTNYSFKK